MSSKKKSYHRTTNSSAEELCKADRYEFRNLFLADRRKLVQSVWNDRECLLLMSLTQYLKEVEYISIKESYDRSAAE
jgi:hypothetical protein